MGKRRLFMRIPAAALLAAALCLTPFFSVRAQGVAAWFRGSAQTWKLLTETSFSAAKFSRVGLSVPLSGVSTGYAVKTTVPNWLSYRLSHSNTFSAAEKKLLTIHPNNPTATLGKLAYLWDRHAILYACSAPGETNTLAFNRHQELLQNTLAEAETFWKPELAKNFYISSFPPEKTGRLLKDPSQPPAFILRRSELEQFAQMTLEEQRAFALLQYRQAGETIARLLETSPETMETFRFSDYYYFKLRRSYFHTLLRVLQNAAAPRRTLIIRVKKRIALPFLPQPEQTLTDAQRLGKLHYYADHTAAAEERAALQTEIARQQDYYRPYALAEAFNAPYEAMLRHNASPADWMFGAEEAARIRLLDSRQAAEEIPGLLQKIHNHKKTLGAPKSDGVDFYTAYFRLCAQEEYLQTRLARANFFLSVRP